MFVNVLRAQQSKSLRSGVFWVGSAALAAVTALMVTLTNTMSDLSVDAPVTLAGQIEEMLEHTGSSSMIHMLVIVLAGALMAGEYGLRSVHLWLSRGVSRTTFLWAKFAAVLVPIVLFSVITAAVTAPLAGAFLHLEHGTLGPLQAEWPGLLWTGLLAAYSMLPYAAFAIMLAVTGRSMLVAVGVGLGATLVAETLATQLMMLVGGRGLDLIALLPASLGPGLLGMDMEGAYTPLEPAIAALLIALYTVAFMGAATLLFRRQDLSD